jgi:hypothetical protein
MPLMLSFIADVFVDLLPIISVNLDHPAFAVLVFSVLEMIRATPYELAKEIYFNCLQSVLVFAPRLGQKLSALRFPVTASDGVKVRAAGVVSMLLELGGRLEGPNLLPDLFWLLQKTLDVRVRDCIPRVASAFGSDSDAIVLQVVHSVFVRNSVPGYAMIEPADCLRDAALQLVRIFARANLREALQVTAKALEYGIKKPAFTLLQQLVVEHANDELWPAVVGEMAELAKYALECDLADSVEFLLVYVSTQTVGWFADSFADNCTQRNPDFFRIAVRIAEICSEDNSLTKRFCDVTFPLFEEVAENAVLLSPDHPAFRSFSSAFYGGLYEALVDTACVVCPTFEFEQYFAFFVVELSRGKEKWRIDASLRGLTAILRRFPARFSTNFIEVALLAVLSLFPEMKGLMETEVARFCRAVALTESPDRSVMDLLLYVTVKIACDSDALMKIIDFYDADLLRMISSELLNVVFVCPHIESLRKLTTKAPDLCAAFSEKCPDDPELRFGVYQLCIQNHMCFDWDQLEAFALANFRKFGVQIAQEALRAGVAELMPRLITAAIRLLGRGDPAVITLLEDCVERWGTNVAVAQSLLRAFAAQLSEGCDRDDCRRLLDSVKQANPKGLLDFALGLQEEPFVAEVIRAVGQT